MAPGVAAGQSWADSSWGGTGTIRWDRRAEARWALQTSLGKAGVGAILAGWGALGLLQGWLHCLEGPISLHVLWKLRKWASLAAVARAMRDVQDLPLSGTQGQGSGLRAHSGPQRRC